MAIDVASLIEALSADPQQRAQLQHVLLGDVPDLAAGLATLAGHVGELAAAQVRTEQHMDQLTERLDRLTERLDRLTERVGELAAAQVRTEQHMDQLTERLDRLTERVGELAAAQVRTEQRMEQLIDTVRGQHDQLATLHGWALEGKYRTNGHAFFAGIARRLRVLDSNDLSEMLDDAEEAGVLSHSAVVDVLGADVVLSGRLRQGAEPAVHLLVEASVTIDRHDVHRAARRGGLLARAVDTEVISVVAGEVVPTPVVLAAQDAGVWVVTNGRPISPEDNIEEQ